MALLEGTYMAEDHIYDSMLAFLNDNPISMCLLDDDSETGKRVDLETYFGF